MYLLIFGIIILVLLVLFGTHMGLQHKRYSLYQPKLQKYLDSIQPNSYNPHVPVYPDNVNVFRPLVEPNEIFQSWYQALQLTKREAWFSTYVWHFHPVETLDVVTPHIYLLGKALKDLDERLDHDVTVNFIVNQARWLMSDQYVHTQWINTWALWEQIGFQGNHVHVNVRVWKHNGLNNIHGKLLLIDNKESVLSSINIEQESYGGQRSWYESGAWITDIKTTTRLVEFLRVYWKDAKMWKWSPEKSIRNDFNVGWFERQYDRQLDVNEYICQRTWPEIFQVHCKIVWDHALAGMYHSNHLDASPITAELVELLLRATFRIDIMTPTFNHPVIWNTLLHVCEKNPELTVRIIMGWRFNVDSPKVQKYLLGYPTNAVFVQDKLAHPQITWKWYGHENNLVHRNSGRMCHAKVVLVDEKYGKSSSFNIDTWSSLNSMEVAFFFNNQNVAQHYHTGLFTPRWEEGIHICQNNLH